MAEPSRLLLCRCACSGVIPANAVSLVEEGLRAAGVPYSVVDDLCGLAADEAQSAQLATGTEPLTVIACFRRAVRWLLSRGGMAFPETQLRVINLRETTAADALAMVTTGSVELPKEGGEELTAPSGDQWIPWYPVVDYDRCTNCKKCLGFCLFDVYGLSAEGRVEVVHPQNCKTNCPACARICPHTAILFPKYEAGPLSGGVVSAEYESAARNGIGEALGGDVYARLRARQQGTPRRFSTAAEDLSTSPQGQTTTATGGGELEALGVPAEVLAALSPEEIARAARRKAALLRDGAAHECPCVQDADGAPCDFKDQVR